MCQHSEGTFNPNSVLRMIKVVRTFVRPETAAYGVAMYGVFKLALSPNMHNPGAKMPSSSLWNSDIPSNARHSDVDPGYTIKMSKIRPQRHRLLDSSVQTILSLKNLAGLHSASVQSFCDSLCI
jgi:hypothetical protein